MKQWMIYGANGYTGRLAIQQAKARGHKPIIAGRDPQTIADLAKAEGLEARVFHLDDKKATLAGLKNIAAVLHCAGPFSATSKPMLDACIATGAAYLDITGEIDVFEAVFARDAELKAKGVTAIPGVGFDVVPSDCLAAMLKERLPDAESLTLAFHTGGGKLSPGTAKTMVESAWRGGRERRGGKIIDVPELRTRTIPFPIRGRTGPERKDSAALLIPWGDVSTAFQSTGIPNIQVFMGAGKQQIAGMKSMRRIRWALKPKPVQSFLQRRIEKNVKGPNAEERAKVRVSLWGEALGPGGKKVTLGLITPEGYALTAVSAIAAIEKVVAGGVPAGALTPSLAFGSRFVTGLEGVELVD